MKRVFTATAVFLLLAPVGVRATADHGEAQKKHPHRSAKSAPAPKTIDLKAEPDPRERRMADGGGQEGSGAAAHAQLAPTTGRPPRHRAKPHELAMHRAAGPRHGGELDLRDLPQTRPVRRERHER